MSFLKDVDAEYIKARVKHPPSENIWKALAVITEEVGELNQAVLQSLGEGNKKNYGDVYKEAVQAAAMCMALILEHVERKP